MCKVQVQKLCGFGSAAMIYSQKTMLDTKHTNLLLIGLVLLLGVQLTGLTCLGEWQIGPADLVRAMDHSPTSDEGVTDDGCPCHFVFQSVSLPGPAILSPLTDNRLFSAVLHMPVFAVIPFHPPVLI